VLPIERPGKIVCVGLNYRDHAEEQGVALPEAPLLFAKWQNTLIGPGEPIVIPPIVTKCDYEAELGVVIGATVRNASAENALEAVAGYICLNDVSARDLQFGDGQWTRGKSPDTFCPVGPRLVPRDEVPDPQALSIRAILNGTTMQDSTTANMVFGVAEVIAYITRTITLEPGDLIATGTPAGVGHFQRPPRYLVAGDQLRCEIEGIGVLENSVVDELPRADDHAAAAGVAELMELAR
jgi:5-carboxymethyl-2-hydroxymuconate isomerase